MIAPRTIRVAINGFGRIGRAAFKIALEKRNLEVVAINDLTDAVTLAHLLQYDTVYGRYEKSVGYDESHIIVDGTTYPIVQEKDPHRLPWKQYRVDVVIESTGRFASKEKAAPHLDAGARRVVISAPTKGGDAPTYLLGVNANRYAGEAIVSNASCTTNCITPVAAIMEEHIGVKKAMMTTVHSYTADQNLVDGPHKDLRRARAAAHNIIPTTTGAAMATTEAMPNLKGRFDALSIRVPTIVVSLSDFTFLVERTTTVEEVNEVLRAAAKSPPYQGILEVVVTPLVSTDFIKNPHSAIVDLSLTQVTDGDLVKVVAWYDNEWGYSSRLVEMVELVGKTL